MSFEFGTSNKFIALYSQYLDFISIQIVVAKNVGVFYLVRPLGRRIM